MQIRDKFFVHNENAAKHSHLPLDSCQVTSRDMSSKPRKITQHKWAIWINDMPKVELAIGSI